MGSWIGVAWTLLEDTYIQSIYGVWNQGMADIRRHAHACHSQPCQQRSITDRTAGSNSRRLFTLQTPYNHEAEPLSGLLHVSVASRPDQWVRP